MRAVRRQVADPSDDGERRAAAEVALPEPIDIAVTLARCLLFAELRLASLAELAELATAVTRNSGEVVFRAGDPIEALFLMRSGQCRLHPSGQRLDAEVDVPPFGTQALLYPCVHGQALRVESDTATFVVLPREGLSAWLRREHVAAAAVFASLANLAVEETPDAARFAEEDQI
jgi:hypothetical protein